MFLIIITWFELDKCNPNGEAYCKNGGTCLLYGNGTLGCKCSEMFEGIHCNDSRFMIKIRLYSNRYYHSYLNMGLLQYYIDICITIEIFR